MPPGAYSGTSKAKASDPIRAAKKAGAFYSWPEDAPGQLLLEFDTIKLKEELDLTDIPSFLHQQHIDADNVELVKRQTEYFDRTAEALKEQCGLTKKAFDTDALTIRLGEQAYNKLPEAWKKSLPLKPGTVIDKSDAPASAKASDVPRTTIEVKKIVKKEKPRYEERLLKRTMEALKEDSLCVTLTEAPAAPKGQPIGSVLCKLWEAAGPQAKTLQEMSEHLSTLYTQLAFLQQNKTEPAHKKEDPEKQHKKRKFLRLPKATSGSKTLAGDSSPEYEQMPTARARTQSAELELAHCSPKTRYDLYAKFVTDAFNEIDLPVKVTIAPTTKGNGYTVELRKPDMIPTRHWAMQSNVCAQLFGWAMNIEPSKCVHSRFQVPMPQHAGLQNAIADIHQQQYKDSKRA